MGVAPMRLFLWSSRLVVSTVAAIIACAGCQPPREARSFAADPPTHDAAGVEVAVTTSAWLSPIGSMSAGTELRRRVDDATPRACGSDRRVIETRSSSGTSRMVADEFIQTSDTLHGDFT